MDTRGKTYTYEIEEKDGGIYKGTKDEAIEEFKKEMFIKYNRIDPSPEIEYIVKEIIMNSILQIENIMTPIEDTPMRQATQLDYNIIDEYKDFYKIMALVLLITVLVCMVKHLELQENILNVLLKNITTNIILIGLLKMVFLQNV